MTPTDENKSIGGHGNRKVSNMFPIRLPTIGWDLGLMTITTFALLAIGIVCVYGVWFSFIAYGKDPNWLYTPVYAQYISMMNTLVYPFIITLLIALGLCIPKRILRRKLLTQANASILFITLLLAVAVDMNTSIWFILVTGIVIQTAVLIMTIIKSGSVFYEREGQIVHIGSSLLHLGTVVFIFDFASMRTSESHITIFWIATILMGLGTVMAFYAEEIRNILKLPEQSSD